MPRVPCVFAHDERAPRPRARERSLREGADLFGELPRRASTSARVPHAATVGNDGPLTRDEALRRLAPAVVAEGPRPLARDRAQTRGVLNRSWSRLARTRVPHAPRASSARPVTESGGARWVGSQRPENGHYRATSRDPVGAPHRVAKARARSPDEGAPDARHRATASSCHACARIGGSRRTGSSARARSSISAQVSPRGAGS